MAESTLSLTLSDLREQVSYKLGHGRAYPSVASKQDHVDDVIKRGLRQFYLHPIHPVIPDLRRQHRWSFLEPWTTIVLWDTTTGTIGSVDVVSPYGITATSAVFYDSMVGHKIVIDSDSSEFTIESTNGTFGTAGTTATVTEDPTGKSGTFTVTADGDYRLPDDWGGKASQLIYDDQIGFGPIEWRASEHITEARNDYTSTGHPAIAAVAPVSHDGSSGQRWNLRVHPAPDADYTLHYKYRVLADALVATTNEYPYGGMEYGDAIMASCEAIAELEKQNAHGGMWEHYITLLQSAINSDRNNVESKTLGKNTNPDDGYRIGLREWVQLNSIGTVVYNGVEYP